MGENLPPPRLAPDIRYTRLSINSDTKGKLFYNKRTSEVVRIYGCITSTPII